MTPSASQAPSRRRKRAAPKAAPWLKTAVEAVPAGLGLAIGTQAHRQDHARGLAAAGVVVGVADNGEHVQSLAAELQLARNIGDELVEAAALAVILGLIDVAGGRIDRDGFVGEAAHVGQRHGGDAAVGGGGDFKDIAVLLAPAAARAGVGFLAGQP